MNATEQLVEVIVLKGREWLHGHVRVKGVPELVEEAIRRVAAENPPRK
jgi:hypothetical protein